MWKATAFTKPNGIRIFIELRLIFFVPRADLPFPPIAVGLFHEDGADRRRSPPIGHSGLGIMFR
jgi:hypothetical protein